MLKAFIEYWTVTCGLDVDELKSYTFKDNDGKATDVTIFIPWYLVHKVDIVAINATLPAGVTCYQTKTRSEDLIEAQTPAYKGKVEYTPSLAISKSVNAIDAFENVYGKK